MSPKLWSWHVALAVIVSVGCRFSCASASVVLRGHDGGALRMSNKPLDSRVALLARGRHESGQGATGRGGSLLSALYPDQSPTPEAQAEAALRLAQSEHTEALHLRSTVGKQAYAVARAAAQQEVNVLINQAGAYYDSVLADLTARMQPDPNSLLAAEAARPHLESIAEASALVAKCNSLAAQAIVEAQAMQEQAVALARQAQVEQSTGNTVLAKTHIFQAHGLLWQAKNRRAAGVKFRKFAEQVNTVIPGYQMAADQAVNGFRPPTNW
eukprot:TRINITY_DN73782_c0_g1_i1.p1 TRINITY_DN73782_c0_g1~~TRINITY_DN73782_c0_g1_i1.p1  ORF type:complete len:269 (-),score=33.82 TRINITY_DN73782_c0_g1_i1:124-930(-)